MTESRKKLCYSIGILIVLNVLLILLFQSAEAVAYKQGSTGQTVREIQQKLTNWGYYNYSIDGIYGSATRNAVKTFQAAHGLSPTGTIDRATYNLLYEEALEAEFEMSEPLPIYIFTNGRSVSKGEKSNFVMLLQMMLNELKIAYDTYEKLNVDGVFGDKTETAIKDFQEKNRLSTTGIVDKKTWNALVENYNKHTAFMQ